MKLLKTYILVSLVTLSSALAAEPSVLLPEITKLMDEANTRRVSQRVSFLISKMLNEAVRTNNDPLDLGRSILIAEQNLPSAALPELVEKIKNDPKVLAALADLNRDSYAFGAEALPINKKFNFQLPLSTDGQYADRTMDAEYISDLRHKINLVGVHLTAQGRTMALRQVGPNNFQFVVITTGTFGKPDELREISGEFTKEQLDDISNQTKTEISNTKGKVNMQPGLNLTNTAVSIFVSAGAPTAIIGAAAATVSLAIDVVTSPFQVSIWAWRKAQLKLKGHNLNKKVDITSNDVLRLSNDQMFQLLSAIAKVRPVTQTNKCIRVYRGI
tara:strand:+ start:21441 stop:22427 length:987 start_codon:yes stop_codon:yes gene_type:complete